MCTDVSLERQRRRPLVRPIAVRVLAPDHEWLTSASLVGARTVVGAVGDPTDYGPARWLTALPLR
jgi:hypothetical protein